MTCNLHCSCDVTCNLHYVLLFLSSLKELQVLQIGDLPLENLWEVLVKIRLSRMKFQYLLNTTRHQRVQNQSQ